MKRISLSLITALGLALCNTQQTVAHPLLIPLAAWIAAPYIGNAWVAKKQQLTKETLNQILSCKRPSTICGFMKPYITIETTLDAKNAQYISTIYDNNQYEIIETPAYTKLEKPAPIHTISYSITDVQQLQKTLNAAHTAAYEYARTDEKIKAILPKK